MRKIKSKNKQEQKTPMSKNTRILLIALGGVILLGIIILMIVEASMGKITVKNKSNNKLEYVKAYFVDAEGMVGEETMYFENINKGEKIADELNKINLSYLEANLEVRFKFEGQDELFVDAGYFNDIFDGNVTISFKDIDEESVLLKVKASSGLVPSPQISCNEEHIINLKEGIVEE